MLCEILAPIFPRHFLHVLLLKFVLLQAGITHYTCDSCKITAPPKGHDPSTYLSHHSSSRPSCYSARASFAIYPTILTSFRPPPQPLLVKTPRCLSIWQPRCLSVCRSIFRGRIQQLPLPCLAAFRHKLLSKGGAMPIPLILPGIVVLGVVAAPFAGAAMAFPNNPVGRWVDEVSPQPASEGACGPCSL
jgi:hypothetical protein